MDKRELKEARGRLEDFLEPLLPLFGRLERRRWGAFYVQGLLLEGGRKTAAGMADRFGGDEQALQQFVSQSPWDWMAVRRQLAKMMLQAADGRAALVLDDTGFPKKGDHSVGVARQYSGTLGKIGNCQIGVSLSYATDLGCFPLDFELYLPKEWTDDLSRRKRAGIPEQITLRPKWRLGLDMIDQARGLGVPGAPVVADAGYGVVTEFRAELKKRNLTYVVGVSRQIAAWDTEVELAGPEYQGLGRPRTRPRDLPPPKSVLDIAGSLPASSWLDVSWREGTNGPLKGRFAVVRVRPANGHTKGKAKEPVQWLVAEWPPESKAPTKFWLSNLPEDTTLRDLVYWAKIRWWVEQNYQQLKDDIGLDHFEGRSYGGWHHHVTLAMIAFCFLVLEGLRVKKNFWVDPPTRPTGAAKGSHDAAWILPGLQETHVPARYLTE